MGADNMIVVVAGLKSSWMDADIQLRSEVFIRCLFVRSQSGLVFGMRRRRRMWAERVVGGSRRCRDCQSTSRKRSGD
jgi:hypothetical protein